MSDDRHPLLWGDPAEAVDEAEIDGLARLLGAQFPDAALEYRAPANWRDIILPAPRLTAPRALNEFVLSDDQSRLLHSAGRSSDDLVRLRAGEATPPDLVAVPRDADEVAAVLAWCADADAVCIPFGGGTSVVGGVTPPASDRPVVTLQLRSMDRVLEVDPVSRAALIQAGATGPGLEEQLRRHDLTLRFFPQSFEYSTLGGWIATRAGGHYATRLTHIDDLVESVTAVTPAGTWSSRRLPGSGAGPSPDRLLLGSEGTLGVITEAWLRVQQRPLYRASAVVRFATFTAGAAAARALAHSGLDPANCRVLDPVEAAFNGAGDGSAALLLLGFESSWRPVDADLAAAIGLCRDLGGVAEESRQHSASGPPADPEDDAAQQWRSAFVRAPYLRDALLGLGMVVETFETATTWDRFDATVADIRAATEHAVGEACGAGVVTCRITHVYPDGAAPYFTVIAPGRHGSQIQQWAAIKEAASEAITTAGATITHHHAVGRDHRPWYDRQRPEPFAAALAAAKRELDPAGILNPGVLLDPA